GHRLERRRHVRCAGARQVQDAPPDVRARGAPSALPLSDSGHRPGARLPRGRHAVLLDGARARRVVGHRLLRPHPAPDTPRLSARPAGLTVAARGAYPEDSTEIPEVFGRNGAAMDSRARRSPPRVNHPVQGTRPYGGDDMRARGLTVPLLCSLAIITGAPAAFAGGPSLYSGPGPRPGRDLPYG